MTTPARVRRRLPYPGLRPFRRDESSLFFGREGCVDQMIDQLAKTRFLAVLGSSGTGKSSLVHTGLLDGLSFGLMAGAEPGWSVASMRPSGAPFENLALALTQLSNRPTPDASELRLFAALLRRGSHSVEEWYWDGNVKPHANLLILVDQFEELFRYKDYAEQEDAEAFVSLLIDSAGARDLPIYVVITMRSEYLGACALIPNLTEKINAGLYLTRRMTRDEIAQAIVGPAEVCGFEIEPPLVNRLLNDLASFAPWESGNKVDPLEALARRADQLPLMQHILNLLWLEAETAATEPGSPITLRLAAYEAQGGLGAALGAHADAVLNDVPETARPVARPLFRALVSGESVATAVRRPCRLAELVELAGGAGEAVRAIVDAYRRFDCNFLVAAPDGELTDDSVIDISHESLIRQWGTLAEWLQEEARAAEKYQDLERQAQLWSQRRRPLLIRGELRDAFSWREAERPSAVWARRYSRAAKPEEGFSLTLSFLHRSAMRGKIWRVSGIFTGFMMALAVLAMTTYGVVQICEQYAIRKGNAYYFSRGAAKNDALARDWYRRAAWLGSSEAESDLGVLYEAGIGGAAPDFREARKWFRKAAKNGSSLAVEQLARSDAGGDGTARTGRQAMPAMGDDAALGSATAEEEIASADLSAGRYPQALADSKKVLNNRLADSQLRADAADRIGLLYEMGKGGIARDKAAARIAFAKALDLEQRILDKTPSDPPAISSVAFQWLLLGDPRNALAMATFALTLAPDQIWMEVNRADALLLLGQTDAARAAYLKHNGHEPDGQGDIWRNDVLNDFETLRDIGVSNPLMGEVTAALAQ